MSRKFSRRALLCGVSVFLLPLPAGAAQKKPPVAPVRPVTDIYFGQKITDPYRWMEAQGPEWQSYVRAEGAYARNILDAIPGRQKLLDQIAHNSAVLTIPGRVQAAGSKFFVELRPPGAETSKLFVRDDASAPPRLLLDPTALPFSPGHALDWWQACDDGSKIVFGVSSGGSEQSILHILTTATGALMDETIDRTAYAAPAWLPDGSGFFYNRLQDVPPGSVEYEQDSACWLHRLGTDPAIDRKVVARGLDPDLPIAPIDAPYIVTVPGAATAILVLAAGVQNELTLYSAPLGGILAGRPGWTRICAPADGITDFSLQGDALFLLTHKEAPRCRVIKTAAARPDLARAQEIVPEGTRIIEAIAAARDALYVLEAWAGLSRLRRVAPDGGGTPAKLPFEGAIDPDGFYATPTRDGAWFTLEGWVHPPVLLHAGAQAVENTGLVPTPPIDTSPYTAQEMFCAARDGTRIPVSIVHAKDQKRTGTAPLLLDAYGAYGMSETPAFLARWLPFLDRGGVFAVAHVRGGGELGEAWHRAGQKLQKYHSWEDMIDTAQALIAANWTGSRHLAIIGGSAGGITVGRFLTQRPDLAAVVISEVGLSDPLRAEFSPNGPPNIPEFGSVTTNAGFHALFAMDAYQHVHDGAQYPSVLLTTGLNDPRVPPWQAGKMAARLQAATGSANPVLLRVEEDAGHGVNASRTQRDTEIADIIAFILWRTGDHRFQPGEGRG